MADLDSRSKRASGVNFLKPYVLALPLPDGAITSQADRQHVAWSYGGIAALQTGLVVTQAPIEVGAISSGTALRVTQLPVEVGQLSTSSAIYVTQCVIEVMYPNPGVCDLVEVPEPPTPVETVTRKIRRVRRVPHVHSGGDWLYYALLEVFVETGIGLASGHGEDPQIMLRFSDDGGHTWSNEHWVSAGRMGKYQARAVWQRLGKSRDRVFEVVVDAPVKWTLLGANLDVTKGQH